jgi:hypothetical protein
VANAIDVDAAVDNPAIVDAEAAAPNPPDMDNRELTDMHERILDGRACDARREAVLGTS